LQLAPIGACAASQLAPARALGLAADKQDACDAPLDMMRCVVVALLLLQSALGFRAGALGATLSTPPASVARRASDGFSLDEMNNPAELAKQLKAEMEEAKAKGDTDRVITLMGTLLSMEGGYEFEGGAGGSSKEGRCAD
jgi:hypothetical protein